MSAQNNILVRGLNGVIFSALGRLIVFKILCLGLLVGAVAVAWLSLSGAYAAAVEYVPDNTILRIVVAVVVALIGLVGLVPIPKFGRKGRVISYPGERGTVAINLDSVEGSLIRAMAKLPEVKKAITVRVSSTAEQKVAVTAEVIPNKEPSVSMRELGYRLSNQIAEMAEHILGEDEVATVDVSFPRLGEAVADLPLARVTQPAAPAEAQEPEEAADSAETDQDVEETLASEGADGLAEPDLVVPGDEDALIPGAASPAVEEDEAGEGDEEEPASGLDLDVEASDEDESPSVTIEEPAWSDEEESKQEDLPEPDDASGASDAAEADGEAEPSGPVEEEPEEGRGW